MTIQDSFLHTTHRTVSWFNKAHGRDELELSAPFQRNPVWAESQKSYLIDTILQGLPVPELYMVDAVDEHGSEVHTVVDGQQRVRAFLEFVHGEYKMDGDDIKPRWRGLGFGDLTPDEKQAVFSYKFVVRVLPDLTEEELRRIFARLNRNVVALNQQELRNATYWGPFISAIQWMADHDPFWGDSGIFSSNDHRRMLDHEYISELAIAYLHGPQNKKDRLDYFYQLHEDSFDRREELIAVFGVTTAEIGQLLPQLTGTRWRKKSDFYTLFLALVDRADEFPFPSDVRRDVSRRILEFGTLVDALSKLEESEWESPNPTAAKYVRSVSRAASDRRNRIERHDAFASFIFGAD